MATNLLAVASNLLAMASNLLAVASNLLAGTSDGPKLCKHIHGAPQPTI